MMKRFFTMGVTLAVALTAVASLALAGSRTDAWLGVYTQQVDPDMARAFDLPVQYGAIVNDVIEDSPADEAGLIEDDIIVAVNDRKVGDDRDLIDLVGDTDPGEEVTLKIWRDGKEQDIRVELGTRPRSMRSGDDFGWSTVPRSLNAPKAPRAPKAPKMYSYYYNGDDSDRAYLGVRLVDLSRPAAQSLGAERDGVLVDEVEEESPAETAGLKAGDLIVAIGDEQVSAAEDIQDIIWDMNEGDKVTVNYVRDRKQASVEVTLAAGDDDPSFGRHNIMRIPDLPDIDMDIPPTRSLWFGGQDDNDSFDSRELQKEMEALQEQLRALEKELQEMKNSRK
jgi:serine protease Do